MTNKRDLSTPLATSFFSKEKRTERKIKRKTKKIEKLTEKMEVRKSKGKKTGKQEVKRENLRDEVRTLKPKKSNASGFSGSKSKTYIYNDPRFKEMGRDKQGNKIKKKK
tara:strand:+ start:295 stop:621 length:327 start_codon:yes stop_codon:yes gene_type:complete